ncbi:MAG TPA: porin [Acidiferrobacterales bacterium]|nr:porin [Acidiferrobacterales bacterium]
MKKKLACLVGASLACCGATAVAASAGDSGISLSGFLTAGGTYADQKVLSTTNAVSQDGNIENKVGFTNDSRIGIQLSAKVNRDVSVTAQLLARGSDEDFNLKADWAFVSYRAADPLTIRGGKLKLTSFLVSDYIEVGYAYPWIRPPQEVYYANPISTMTGADALVRFNFGDYSLLFQPYYGNSRGEQALVPQEAVVNPPLSQPAGTVMSVGFTTDSLTGVNLSFGSDIFTVRAGYLQTLVSAPDFGVSYEKATFTSVGGTLDWKGLVFYTEYFQREIEGMANGAFPNQKGAYATIGYRFGKFLPHITYATLDDNDNPATLMGLPLKQTSATLGLRYELGTGAALKFEAQQVKPECTGKPFEICRGLLIANPNLGPERSESVMIYSLAVDVVF